MVDGRCVSEVGKEGIGGQSCRGDFNIFFFVDGWN